MSLRKGKEQVKIKEEINNFTAFGHVGLVLSNINE
jgi:hypothetical protein